MVLLTSEGRPNEIYFATIDVQFRQYYDVFINSFEFLSQSYQFGQ